MISFHIKWTFGKVVDVLAEHHETFEEILSKNEISNPLDSNIITKLFYKGKQIPLEMTIDGADIKNGSFVIILQKCKETKTHINQQNVPSTFTQTMKSKQQKKRKLINEVVSKKIDQLYNSFEMQTKKDLIYKEALMKQIQYEESIAANSNKSSLSTTNLEYENQISEDPLPLFFAHPQRKVPKPHHNQESRCNIEVRVPLSKSRRNSYDF